MKMKVLARYILVTAAMLASIAGLSAQELKCEVEINSTQVQNTSKEVFNKLQQAIADYMNTTKWTDAQFSVNEKIECRMYFTIKSYTDNLMQGDLQVQSSRPVYNSSYTTTVMNFKDTKIEFTYQENEPLVYSETTMESNLTAILNFYAFMIIALDFDTFSLKGGEPYYEKAANVVRMAQSAGESGWKAFEDTKNRSAVLSAFTEGNTSGIRDILYNYHRRGLDEMALSVDKGRAMVTQMMETLKKVFDTAPMSVCLSMWKDAKLDELVNIYSKAGQTEKDKVYDLLYAVYPTEQTRLKKIKEEYKDF